MKQNQDKPMPNDERRTKQYLVLAETLGAAIQLCQRLQAMGDGDATWPRVGTLLSVKADLADVMAKLPEAK